MRPCGVCGTALWFDQWNCSRAHICAESGIARNLWCSWPPSAVEESESGEQRQQSGGDEARVTCASVSVSIVPTRLARSAPTPIDIRHGMIWGWISGGQGCYRRGEQA